MTGHPGLYYSMLFSKSFNCTMFNFFLDRNAQWVADEKWARQFGGKLLVPSPEFLQEHRELEKQIQFHPAYRVFDTRPKEKIVKNMELNFGPQHPAAHGVLRLVSEISLKLPSLRFLS